MFRLLLFFLFSCSVNAKVLRINIPAPIEHFEQHETLIVFKAAVAELNLRVEYDSKPLARRLMELNRGTVDGDLAIVAMDLNELSNVIRVNEPVGHTQIVALYFKHQVATIDSLDDLKNYHVGFLAGWVAYKKVAKRGKTFGSSTSIRALLRMLKAKRFDVVIIEKDMEKFLDSPTDSYGVSPVLSSQPLYFYMHKKHKKLCKQLATTFAMIKRKE